MELILKVLRIEDLLTMVTKKKQRLQCSDANPSGYSARKMITDEEGDHAISADDQFLYTHDFARLYVAINIATSESLQFLFSEATSFDNGVALRDSIVAKLFGTTYKDALDAADKLRRWSIDPSKHLQHDLHNLMLLVKRANETSKSILSETSILGIIYEAISKDPREELRMTSTYSSRNNQSLEEFISSLHKSPHAGPYYSRHVKMNEFNPAVIRYGNNFQEEKCRFGEKCKYKHEINPEFKKKEIIGDDRKKNNIITNKNNNKIHFKKKNFNTSTSHNNITGQHRDVYVEGKPPKYSHQRHSPIHNFNKTDDHSMIKIQIGVSLRHQVIMT